MTMAEFLRDVSLTVQTMNEDLRLKVDLQN